MARLFDLVIRLVWRGWLKTATLRRVKFDDLITQNQLLLSFCIGLLGTLFFSAAHFWLSWLTAMSIASIFRPSTRVFVGLSTGLLMGAFHFQSFSAAPLNPSCYTKPVNFSREVTNFPKRLIGKPGEPLTLMTSDLRTISAENLRAFIIEKAGSRRDIPVPIVADGDTRHAMVVMSMDTVSQLGFKRLSISTQRPVAGE